MGYRMKNEIETAVREKRIVAIIRGFAPETCLRLAEAYAAGGIWMVEVTFNQKSPETWKDTAAAIAAIRSLADKGVLLVEKSNVA